MIDPRRPARTVKDLSVTITLNTDAEINAMREIVYRFHALGTSGFQRSDESVLATEIYEALR